MEKIVIFGTGAYSEKFISAIEMQYEILAIIDNKIESGQIGKFHDKKVYNPWDCKLIFQFPVIVLINKYTDVVKQLEKMGVADENIWICNNDAEFSYFTNASVKKIIELANSPISEDWGFRRGKPIGRAYIDMFLTEYKEKIVGDIMEIGDTTYSEKFSEGNEVNSFTAIHVDGIPGTRKANLETGEGIFCEEFDTMIVTQTLAYIYDLDAVVNNIYKALKPGGYCLVTVTDIGHMGSYEKDKYGIYWGFHKDGCKKLFSDVFGENNVSVELYGNIKSAVAHMYGLSSEDIEKSVLEEKDERYPVIIGVCIHKE